MFAIVVCKVANGRQPIAGPPFTRPAISDETVASGGRFSFPPNLQIHSEPRGSCSNGNLKSQLLPDEHLLTENMPIALLSSEHDNPSDISGRFVPLAL